MGKSLNDTGSVYCVIEVCSLLEKSRKLSEFRDLLDAHFSFIHAVNK